MRDASAVRWRKSSRSGAEGGDCVEVASVDPAVALRDSKNPDGPTLILNATAWLTFTREIKASQYDLT